MDDTSIDALRATSEQLYAEHQRLHAEFARVAQIREQASTAAVLRQRAAYAAEEYAWERLSAARDAAATAPADPARAAALDQAQAAYTAAWKESSAAYQHACDVQSRCPDDTAQEVKRQVGLGARFRAADDALWQAEAVARAATQAGVIPAPLPSITCPRCRRTSHHRDDVREGYCGHCHDWTTGRDRSPAADQATEA